MPATLYVLQVMSIFISIPGTGEDMSKGSEAQNSCGAFVSQGILAIVYNTVTKKGPEEVKK